MIYIDEFSVHRKCMIGSLSVLEGFFVGWKRFLLEKPTVRAIEL